VFLLLSYHPVRISTGVPRFWFWFREGADSRVALQDLITMAEVVSGEGAEEQLDSNKLELGYGSHEKNRIQVSNTKKPLFFYVNLAKRYMQQHDEVELSALGMAIATVVTVAEILKNNGLAVERRILTSTIDMRDEARGRPIQKAKVEIVLAKSENFDELMAAAAEEREVAPEVNGN
jgi:DNA-binding protein